MSGDYFTHVDRDVRDRYEELLLRHSAAWKAIDKLTEKVGELEHKLSNYNLYMKRSDDHKYEKLVDVVCDHDKCITQLIERTSDGDVNW